jgi:D-alanyl-lipoteichoic acid acyltransferase DltB (MBOAT superfamily)
MAFLGVITVRFHCLHEIDLGWAFTVAVIVSLFIGVQVMFEIREEEKRRGINLRC